MLAARLARVRLKQDKYHGHLVQDRNQACYKDIVLNNMSIHAFYLLVDYWAKVGISKPGGTACCEGDSIGLSAHGSMFVYRNPTTEERAEISKEHGGVDWSSFPAPPDKGGLTFLEEHAIAYCDDAKQNQFHTKSVIEATVRAFVVARPWLGKDRVSFGQSDGASNYRDPTVDVDCGALGSRCFSVAGMGKDEGDSNGADNKGKVARQRDAGDGVQCADDLVAISSKAPVPANTYARLDVNRRKNHEVVGRASFPRHIHVFTIDATHITFYEYLDPAASVGSIKATGRVVGYGRGDVKTLAQFNDKQRSQVATETGASLALSSGGWASAKARPSRDEQKEMAVQKEEKKRKKTELQEAREAEERAVAESQHRNDIDVCPRCGLRFLTAGGFGRHYMGGCRKYTTNEVRERRRKARDVKLRLVALDELWALEEEQRRKDLATVTVTLSNPHGQAVPVGIEVEEQERGGDGSMEASAFVVSSVSGLALESARVSVGFVVAVVGDGSTAVSASSFPKELPAGGKLEVTFRRPRPAVPTRGCARETIHKEPRFVLHEEQEAFLVEVILAPMMRGEQPPRPFCVHELMKAKFGDKLRMDTKTPMCLEKAQIEKWQAERKKEIKQKKKQEQQRPKAAAEEEVPNTKKAKKAKTAPTKSSSSVKKGKAAAPAAKKRKAAASSSESEEEDGDFDDDGDSDESMDDDDDDDDEC